MTTTEDGGNMTIFNIFRQINTVIPYAVLFSLAMIIIVLVFEVTKKYKNRQKKQIKNNFRYSSHGIISVSYTHLDVYKRQELSLGKKALEKCYTLQPTKKGTA